MTTHSLAECRMLDGTIIKGWFYATEKPAPAIIMSHGVCSLASTDYED